MRPVLNLFLIVVAVLFAGKTFGQNTVIFAYDAAGNQQERQLICVNCVANAKLTDSLDLKIQDDFTKAQALKTQDSLARLGRKIIAYPNPVTEVLNLSWAATDNSFVSQINVFSMLGVRFYHHIFVAQQNQVTISFLSLASGLYMVQAIYNDGRQENIKVIKQ